MFDQPEYSIPIWVLKEVLVKRLNRLNPNQIFSNLCRREHTGKACPGMGSCTYKVEVTHILAEVLRTKPGRLRQDRFDGKDRAFVTVECILKMTWIDVVLG